NKESAMWLLRATKTALMRSREIVACAAAVVGLVALMVWIAASASAQKEKTNEGSGEAFIPLDAECLVQVRFGEVWNSDFGKLWREMLPVKSRGFGPAVQAHWKEIIEDVFATEPESIETLLVAQSNSPMAMELLALGQFGRLKYQDSPFRDNPKMTGTGTKWDFSTETRTTETYSETRKVPAETRKDTPAKESREL